MEVGFVQEYRNKRLAAYWRMQQWIAGHEAVAKFGGALVMALLTGLLAQIAVYTPLSPVPYTGQVFGVALMGGLLGRKWGTISATMYVLLGIVGLPVYAAGGHGIGVFASGLSAGYLLGFILQAYFVGLVVDQRREGSNRTLTTFSVVSIVGLIAFALLDVYLIANYAALYPRSPTAFPNPWFAVLCLGLLAMAAACAWLAFTSKARRERIELFFGNIVGLLVLYLIGAVWFWGMWATLGFGELSFMGLLRFTVLPFIPADLTKILIAVGLLTLVRPTQREIGNNRVETPA